MIYIIWFVLFGLVAFSFFSSIIPIWIPFVFYVIALGIRIWQKIGDNNDWLEKSKRDEKVKLAEVASDMANRGLTFSGFRKQEEDKIVDEFKYERKKRKRQLGVDLVDCLFLKK